MNRLQKIKKSILEWTEIFLGLFASMSLFILPMAGWTVGETLPVVGAGYALYALFHILNKEEEATHLW